MPFASFQPETLVAHLPYPGLVLLLVLGTLGFPFPEDGILLLAGVLYAQGAVELLPVVLLLYVAVLCTDYALFAAGRKFGRHIVEHRRFRRVMSQHTLDRLERAFQRWRFWVILGGRNLIGLRAQVFLASGVLGVTPRRFLAADGLAAAVSIGVWMTIGYFGAQGFGALAGSAHAVQYIATITVVTSVAAGLVVVWWLKRRRV